MFLPSLSKEALALLEPSTLEMLATKKDEYARLDDAEKAVVSKEREHLQQVLDDLMVKGSGMLAGIDKTHGANRLGSPRISIQTSATVGNVSANLMVFHRNEDGSGSFIEFLITPMEAEEMIEKLSRFLEAKVVMEANDYLRRALYP